MTPCELWGPDGPQQHNVESTVRGLRVCVCACSQCVHAEAVPGDGDLYCTDRSRHSACARFRAYVIVGLL